MEKTKIKKFGWLYIISAFIFSFFSFPRVSLAGIDLPWSTTFNCPEWVQCSGNPDADPCNNNIPPNCDGIKQWSDYYPASSGKLEEITSAANNPGGGGGKGLLHWIGDGINVGSGAIQIKFNTRQKELWIRWYQKYQLGFTWNESKGLVYTKTIYMNMGQDSSFNTGFHGTNNWQIEVYYDSPQTHYLDSGGWNTVMKNGQSNGSYRKSDGKWHCYEIHVKRQTSGANGIFELWLDGVYMGKINNITFSGTAAFDNFQIPGNQRYPANNGKMMQVFVDDIAISNTGYIPPLEPVAGVGLPDTTSPQVPQQFKLSINND